MVNLLPAIGEYLKNGDGNALMNELNANGVIKFDIKNGTDVELGKEEVS